MTGRPPRANPARATSAGRAEPFRQGAQRTRIDGVLGRSPLLAHLTAQAGQMQQLLEHIKPSLPAALRDVVQAGPLAGREWCVIVPNSAVAAKLRHCVPLILEALAQRDDVGAPVVERVRVRIATA